jgi:hypothetical protein
MTTPDAPAAPDLVWVYCTNGTATSGGNGPGPVQVPPDEAAWLIGECLAVAGQLAPMGYLGPFAPVTP